MTDASAVACPRCDTPGASRFCGHCGALVRPRTAEPALPEVSPAEVPEDATGGERDEPASPAEVGPAAPPRRFGRAVIAVPLVVAAVALAALQLRPPPPETITLGNGSALGAGGTGVTSDRSVTDLTERWHARGGGLAEGQVVWTEPVGQDGTDAFLHVEGDLLRLDTTTGEIRWRVPVAMAVRGHVPSELLVVSGDEVAELDPTTGALGTRDRLAEPVRFDQLGVAVGDELVVTSGPVTGYDRSTGEVRWRHEGWLESVRGHVGVVRGEHPRVLDLRDGRTLWEPAPPSPSGWYASALLDELLVVAGRELTAYDLETGELRWQVQDLPPGHDRGHFLVTDGVVTTIPAGGARPLAEQATWHAFDREGRAVAVPVGLTSQTQTLVRAAGTWIHLTDGQVVAERDGEVVWRRDTTGFDVTAVGAGVVVTEHDRSALLDVATGEELRTFVPKQPGWHAPGRALLGGCLVASELVELAVRLHDGEACWASDDRPRPYPSRVLPGDGVVVAVGGRIRGVGPGAAERWSRDPGDAEVVPLTERWSALVPHSAYDGDGDLQPLEVPLLDSRTGATPSSLRLAGHPWSWVGRDDLVVAHSSSPDGREARLSLWDLPTEERPEPRQRWEIPSFHPQVAITPDAVVVLGSTSLTELDLADGSVTARIPLVVRVPEHRALHDEVLVGVSTSDRLVGLDRRDGSLVWELNLPGDAATAPTIAGDIAYVAVAPSRLLAVDVRDGEVVASAELDDAIAGPPTAAAGRVLVPTVDGFVAFGPELATDVSSPAGRRDR